MAEDMQQSGEAPGSAAGQFYSLLRLHGLTEARPWPCAKRRAGPMS